MRGTFRHWRARVRRNNWNRRKLERHNFRPDWKFAGSRDRNTLLHRVVWVNPDGRVQT